MDLPSSLTVPEVCVLRCVCYTGGWSIGVPVACQQSCSTNGTSRCEGRLYAVQCAAASLSVVVVQLAQLLFTQAPTATVVCLCRVVCACVDSLAAADSGQVLHDAAAGAAHYQQGKTGRVMMMVVSCHNRHSTVQCVCARKCSRTPALPGSMQKPPQQRHDLLPACGASISQQAVWCCSTTPTATGPQCRSIPNVPSRSSSSCSRTSSLATTAGVQSNSAVI